MGIEVSWRSQKGSRTEDNRDCCGLAERPDAVLCIVVDGATVCPKGGELAREIVQELIDWFVSVDIGVNAQAIITIMQSIHKNLSQKFPFDSASYVITLIQDGNPIIILHAGDCLLGHHNEENNSIQWLIKPHTLANATEDMSISSILECPARHRLTRSFRPREFMEPETNEIGTHHGDLFVVATDGYWADLNPEDQGKFIEDIEVTATCESDDRSALQIRILDNHTKSKVLTRDSDLDNFYMRSL